MLAEQDETGEIWEVDYRRGILVKHFFIGDAVKGDFEAITVANDVVFLLASNGRISVFHEGANNAHVAYSVIETGLKKECEFESMVFDPTINSLVLACKHIHDKDVHDAIVLYRWSLASDTTTARLSKVTVSLVDVLKENNWKHFHPVGHHDRPTDRQLSPHCIARKGDDRDDAGGIGGLGACAAGGSSAGGRSRGHEGQHSGRERRGDVGPGDYHAL